MTAHYRIITRFVAANGQVRDDVIAGHYFTTDEVDPTPTVGSALIGHVAAAFETVTAPGTVKPSSLISPEMSRVIVPVGKAYDADVPGSPLATANWLAFTAASNAQGLPSQVACVLSINGDLTNVAEEAPDDLDADTAPERPASRRRGKEYFGPLHVGVLTTVAGQARPNGVLRDALLGLAKFLANPTNPTLTAVDTQYVIQSKASGPLPDYYPVIRARVDDAFDVVRRRRILKSNAVTLALP